MRELQECSFESRKTAKHCIFQYRLLHYLQGVKPKKTQRLLKTLQKSAKIASIFNQEPVTFCKFNYEGS